MTYRIELLPAAVRSIADLPKNITAKIDAHIVALATTPRPVGSKKLRGVNPTTYRLRVGDYRVVYRVDDGGRVVLVVDVGHRREVYRS